MQPYHPYDCPYSILQIALVANEYATLFYLQGARRQWLKVNCADIVLCAHARWDDENAYRTRNVKKGFEILDLDEKK